MFEAITAWLDYLSRSLSLSLSLTLSSLSLSSGTSNLTKGGGYQKGASFCGQERTTDPVATQEAS